MNFARKTPLRGKANGNVRKITQFFETLQDQSYVGIGVENLSLRFRPTKTNTTTADEGVGRADHWVKEGVGVTTGPLDQLNLFNEHQGIMTAGQS